MGEERVMSLMDILNTPIQTIFWNAACGIALAWGIILGLYAVVQIALAIATGFSNLGKAIDRAKSRLSAWWNRVGPGARTR
jgi:uncharacterized membrane protein YhiD involved in acid resistance